GRMSSAFFEMEPTQSNDEVIKPKDVLLAKDENRPEKEFIPNHIIRFALSQNPFFYFDNLLHYFPSLGSLSNFIESKDFLGDLEITFVGTANRIKEISLFDYLQALNGLLQTIEEDIKKNSTEYEGSDYIKEPIHKVFKDKTIRVEKGSEKDKGQLGSSKEEFRIPLEDKEWYVFNDNYGTIEEKGFVSLFARRFEGLNQKFE